MQICYCLQIIKVWCRHLWMQQEVDQWKVFILFWFFYLYIGHYLQWYGGQVEWVHGEVHQVPPVVDVLCESTVPHLLNLCPDEAWNTWCVDVYIKTTSSACVSTLMLSISRFCLPSWLFKPLLNVFIWQQPLVHSKEQMHLLCTTEFGPSQVLV